MTPDPTIGGARRPPSPHDRWRTRGELLAARAELLPQLARRLLSPARLAAQVLLTLVVAVAGLMAAQALADGSGDTTTHVVLAVLFGAIGLAAAVVVVRRALQNRRLVAQVLAWVEVERASRELPAGAVGRGVRAPFDARADADFEEVALAAFRHPYAEPTSLRLLARGGLGGAGLVVGSVLVLMAVDGGLPAAVVPGAFVLLSSLVLCAAATRWSYRFQRIGGQLEADRQVFRAERVGVPAAAEVARAEKRTRAVLLAPLALVPAVLLLARLGADAVPSWVVVVVVAGGVLLSSVGAAMLRRLRSGVRTPEG